MYNLLISYSRKPSEDVKVLNLGNHIQLTKEEPSSEIDDVRVIQRLTGELQEGSTDMNQTWHISCEVSLYLLSCGRNVSHISYVKSVLFHTINFHSAVK